jgi:hypothetical protein
MLFDKAKVEFSKQTQTIIKIASVVGAITVIAGGYAFFINNIWQPNVKIVSVDYDNGFATLKLPFGKLLQIYGSSEFLIGGDWGVRFGTTLKNGKVSYERIELIKKGMVEKILTNPST